ncbi:F-box protein At5g07610-like [Bidens hawaiensis]|uniref:F-box protein At5g07610-like n=1 Tax=Bidens hawaiensis TaxID=980011 RepID=UPI0040494F14
MEDSDHHHHQSVAVIGSNDDILTEILIRLPVTSILRFKSVSKNWRLLLSHRCFTHRCVPKSPGLFFHTFLLEPDDIYSEPEPEPHCLYVPFDVEDQTTPPFRNLDFYFNRYCVRIMQSCNGLLLCYAHTFYNGGSEYYVFNHTTKQLAFIPPVPGGQSVSKTILSMALAFHQTHCVHYKVVCIRALDANVFQVQVYSSDTGKWKLCIESFSAPSMFRDPVNWNGESSHAPVPIFHNPVYWNGAVQWAPHYRSTNHLYFKIDDERLQMLPLPEGFGSDESYLIMYFGESIGHLHLILRRDRKQDILSVNVYEMLRDHSRWFVKYRLQLDALLVDFPCLTYPPYYQSVDDFGVLVNSYRSDFDIADVVRGKDEEDKFLVLGTYRKLIRYNVHDKSVKELCSCDMLRWGYPGFHRYIETLSSF